MCLCMWVCVLWFLSFVLFQTYWAATTGFRLLCQVKDVGIMPLASPNRNSIPPSNAAGKLMTIKPIMQVNLRAYFIFWRCTSRPSKPVRQVNNHVERSKEIVSCLPGWNSQLVRTHPYETNTLRVIRTVGYWCVYVCYIFTGTQTLTNRRNIDENEEVDSRNPYWDPSLHTQVL